MQELKAFFHTHSTDTQEAKELFNRVLEQAQHFKIKVNFTNDLPRGASGEYDKYYLVKILDDYHPEYKAQTLFHELIHSVTTNAIMLVNVRTHLDKTLLHPKQIEAVNTITTIYKDIKTKFPKFSAVSRNYGMKNEFEFIAELANPEFRDKLKKLNVFEKIVDAITKIVVYLKDSVRGYGKPTGNAYEKTKKALIDIIDNYDKDFLEKYINTYKKEGMSSQAHYNLKLESKFLNDKGEIDLSKIEGRELPKADFNSTQNFKAKFQKVQGKYGYIQTPYKEVKVNMGYAYRHFYQNTHNVNRDYIKGAFFDTFVNPLFVAKKHTDKGESVYFYNVYKDSKDNNLGIFGIGVDSKGNVDFRTLYKDGGNVRLKEMIKLDDENIVYVSPALTLPNHNTIAEFSRPSTAMDSASTTSGKKQGLQSNSTIDSKLLSKVQSKFNYDEKKASDLLEWHKDSSPITKDKDGLPKVFYHGSGEKFEVFEGGNDELGREGMYFSSSKKVAESYKIWDEDEVYSVFLNIKNPLVIDAQGNNYNSKFFMAKLREARESGAIHNHDGAIFKNIRDEMAQGNGELADTIVVFDSKQIKHIKNKGSYIDESGNITSTKPKDTEAEHRYFNENSPNIYYSNQHIGTGLASGTLSGLETDEEGNIIGFNPQKFALGFLGGSAGSIAFKKGKDFLDKNPKYKEAIKKELADTLAQGFESASKKYPMLNMLKPIKLNIMQSEKGRIAQAGHLLNKIEKQEIHTQRETTKELLSKIVGQDIINANDGVVAQVSKKNISKMLRAIRQ